jgi:hypothetical protein
VNWMEVSDAAVTVRVVLPLIVPIVAVIVEVPFATAVARPVLAPIVAVAVELDDHAACVVTSVDVPSVYVPRAENCVFRPATTMGLVGLTAIDFRVFAVTVSIAVPDFDM